MSLNPFAAITRRTALAAASGAAFATFTPLAVSQSPGRRTSLGIANDSVPSRRRLSTLEFLDVVKSFGMGGAQIALSSLDSAYARSVRAQLEESGLFYFVSASINDIERFRQTVALAKEAGASGIRVASGGRRYEDFSTLAERQAHVARVLARIQEAVPVAEAARMPIALENHKDFTLEEQVRLHRQYDSEFFGACVDTGNNLALLDDPMEVVEQLAPFAVTAHLKDATLEEYEEGFLLGDIPLGEGFLNLKRVVEALRKHRPQLPLLLECITRNPLRIPCLTEKYWATFPERNGSVLARTLRLVRANKPRWQMKVPQNPTTELLREMETKHVEMSVACARNQLGLT